MNKRYILMALSVIAISAFGIERSGSEAITVKTRKNSINILIDSDTTIGDVKLYFEGIEGAPADAQVLRPVTRGWRTLGFAAHGRALNDNDNVKAVMRQYWTQTFAWSLILQRRAHNNNG
jgi:hypothetical protein